ncbi:MAG TPA: rRNA pseudouridine synthase [Clostridiaceae bacterium]|nr:rRNA pseudouridine synthase [Clostridiaceae bacterium]
MSNTIRLDKMLSNLGYGSRKEIKQLVKQGAVIVDGTIASDSSMHVYPEESVVEINGEVVKYKKFVYIMLNKPQGVISATYDDKLKTVVDLLDERLKKIGLFPVGRLDIDTEGLLLLTNDGMLAHELLSPKKHIAKKYYALVEGIIDNDTVKKFSEGIILDDGYKTLPSELIIIKSGRYSEAEVIIYEGKFHQVKRMFLAAGSKVRFLKRLEMASLKLDETLKPGEYRELTEKELNLLLEYKH